MEKVKLQKLSLGSFLKLNCWGAFVFGLLIGGIGLVFSIVSPAAVNYEWQNITFSGWKAGILVFVTFPILWSLVFWIFAVFNGIGLKVYLFILRGIKVKAKFKVIEEKAAPVKVEPVAVEQPIEEPKIEEIVIEEPQETKSKKTKK